MRRSLSSPPSCAPTTAIRDSSAFPIDYWHPEVVKVAVVGARFDFKKLDLGEVDLRTEAQEGGCLIDGVLNSSYVKRESGKEVRIDTDPDDTTTPVDNEGGWRHSIAVRNGRILERQFTTSADWLWLGANNQPDTSKGYLYKVLKVYRITKRSTKQRGCTSASTTC